MRLEATGNQPETEIIHISKKRNILQIILCRTKVLRKFLACFENRP